jgi:hypothetical protein
MLLVALIERAKIDSRTLLQISAVLSVAFLIRLDALAVYAAVVICLPPYAVWNGKLHLRAVLALIPKVAWQISVFVVPTVLVYMALNQWLFGAPVPISGLAKAIGGPRFANWGAAQAFLQNGSALLGFLVLLVMLELGVRRFDSPPAATFYRSIVITSVATAIQAFYYSAFSTWPVWPWYSYLVDMNLALVIGRILYLCSLLYKPLSHPVVGARVVATATLLFIAAWTSRYTLTLSAITRVPVIADARQKFLPGSHQSQNAAGITYNEISLDMLDSFFPTGRVTRIAMGDRGGGLAYWGRDRLSVIQTEGILLDMGYIRAREANSGAQYLEHLPIDYLITDRETIAKVVGTDGQLLYVVPDPVQGRVTFDPVPTFCFPANAVHYEKDYVSTFQGVSKRLAFLFSARVPCPGAATSLVRSIETGIGLRQYSLPVEYDPAKGDIANKSSEDRDRRRAFRVSIRSAGNTP